MVKRHNCHLAFVSCFEFQFFIKNLKCYLHCISLKLIGTRVEKGLVILLGVFFVWGLCFFFFFVAVSVQTKGTESLLKCRNENP